MDNSEDSKMEVVVDDQAAQAERIRLDQSISPTPPKSTTPVNDEDDDDITRTQKELNSPRSEDKKLEKIVARQEVMAIQESKKSQKARLTALRDAQNSEMDKSKKANAEARLAFLQQQVEVFSHFTGGVVPEPEETKKGKKGGKKEGRTRMTEEEEDKLLIDAGKQGVRATRLTVQPGCIKFGQMRPYQIEGLNWMINLYEQGLNGILADEMGLGKTLQSISLLGYLKFERGVTGPHMVLVPKAVMTNWLREFARWCPELRTIHVHGTKEERQHQIENDLQAGNFDVCVTTFEVLMIERSSFLKFQWRYLIVDEAHRLKSETTRTSQIVRELDTQFRLLVTGTPLQNNLHELWALLNFLLPEVFGDAEVFEEYFKLEDMAEESVVSKLHAILRPFMLRRLKADVEKSLPPKREIKLYTGMSEMQEYWYKTVLNRDVAALNQLGGPDRSRLLNILMQLRKVCNHPYLFQGAEPGPPYIDGPHLFENCGKLYLLDKLLTKLKKNGDRVLIFSQMTRLLDILEDYMRFKGYEYCRIDGSSKGEDRDHEMDTFNAPGSTKFCFLLSTRAGGLGINLATANIVVLYDSDWNPQMDLQAQDRAHRIGQTKEVTVFRLITEGTIEEKIVERAEKKLYLDAVVVQQGRLQQQNAALSKNELMTMVKFGAEAIFRSGGRKISDDDIDIILERDAKRTEETRERFKTDVQHNLLNFKLDQIDEGSVLMAPDPTAQVGGSTGNFINLPSRTARITARREVEQEEAVQAKPRGMAMHDFQFFDQARIRAIEEQEHEYAMRRKTQQVLIREAKIRERKERGATGPAEGEDAPTTKEDGTMLDSERLTQELNEMVVPQEVADEKQRLIAEGFQTWQKKDFRIYVAAVEKFGRNATEDVVTTVAEQTQKDKEEVRKYHEIFWQRYKEIEGWDKIIEKIEKGEQKLKRRAEIADLLKKKVGESKNPTQTLEIEYGATKGKVFTEDEDRFLVCSMYRLGYGSWDMIRQEIRKSWLFRFDWFLKSRSSEEIKRRCEALIRMIEKQYEDDAGGGAGGDKGTSEKVSRKRKQADVSAVKADVEEAVPSAGRKRAQTAKA